jgi:hypothetical protein
MKNVRQAGPLLSNLPIITHLHGSANGVIDLGAIPPIEVIAQADLRTNPAYKLGLLFSHIGADKIGGNVILDTPGGNFQNEAASLNAPLVNIVSDTEGDTRLVTLYGSIHNILVIAVGSAPLNGTNNVSVTNSKSSSWGFILGAEVAAHETATLTIKTAGGSTICTIGPGATSAGIVAVPANLQDFGGLPMAVKSDSTGTQQVGVIGRNPVGTTIYDVTQLNGANQVNGVMGMARVDKLLVGTVPHPGDATDRHVTLRIGPLTYGAAECMLQDLGAMDNGRGRIIGPTSRYLHWCLSTGTMAVSGGIADWLKLGCWG